MSKLEKVDERRFCAYVVKNGDLCPKVGWHGQRGWPDREILLHSGKHFYMEFKREGEELRPLQEYVHRLLRERGHRVYVVDNYQDAVTIYEKEKNGRVQAEEVPKNSD